MYHNSSTPRSNPVLLSPCFSSYSQAKSFKNISPQVIIKRMHFCHYQNSKLDFNLFLMKPWQVQALSSPIETCLFCFVFSKEGEKLLWNFTKRNIERILSRLDLFISPPPCRFSFSFLVPLFPISFSPSNPFIYRPSSSV